MFGRKKSLPVVNRDPVVLPPKAFLVRKGMWVCMTHNVLGILVSFDPIKGKGVLGTVHVIDKDNGRTTDIKTGVDVMSLRQARLHELPAIRLKGQSEEVLTRLGYV